MTPPPDSLADRLAAVRERIRTAAQRARREESSVRLIAVSKRVETDRIREALAAGQIAFGENYAQELRDKRGALTDLPIEWHFIGALQRNKVKYVAGRVRLIHGVDDAELLAEIERRALAAGFVQEVLVEVNLSGEASKAGAPPGDVPLLLDAFARHAAVRCVGLMTMPPADAEGEGARPYFAELRRLRDDLAAAQRPQVNLRELSMGMSADYEVAIEEGATLVRIGTAIFGPRE